MGGVFPPRDYTRGDSPVSTGFRGINAYVFQGAKNIVLKNFKIFYYRGILHTILDLTLRPLKDKGVLVSKLRIYLIGLFFTPEN